MQVISFWSALLVELRDSLHHDVFNLRQQLSRTLAMTISYLGGLPKNVASGGNSRCLTDQTVPEFLSWEQLHTNVRGLPKHGASGGK